MSDVAAATVAPDKEHRLPDGRALAYCEYGVPNGVPVFNFHGLPGSRIDTRIIADEARAAGLRLITADRPGIGRSDRSLASGRMRAGLTTSPTSPTLSAS